MRIELPPHKTIGEAQFINNLRSLTIIGANGAGKSRFGDYVAHHCGNNVFNVSALKALYINTDNEAYTGSSITQLYNELQAKVTYKTEAVDTSCYVLFCRTVAQKIRRRACCDGNARTDSNSQNHAAESKTPTKHSQYTRAQRSDRKSEKRR